MIAYDFLLNATGPYLNFEATPGLGPSTGNTTSVCSVEHAVEAATAISTSCASSRPATPAHRRGRRPRRRDLRGSRFEYLMNVERDLRARGIRDAAELVWVTNEPEAGDSAWNGIEAIKRGVLVTGASLVRMISTKLGSFPRSRPALRKSIPACFTTNKSAKIPERSNTTWRC